ncbi:hypothetical protein DOTSEDRAFT_74044 [Dothistroma septosporum NZE10]|uniref:AAA+ ATPase domain-containing protein n=1 Tax=Dothistroma septosporum (strain NZE10 / CBS 128990) TaxID=675120 RepID=N1PKM2_DOTSN|nr:hypothetical protein DOTSEDRAFT_74044 [Dothistroma septosporum NZE10]
MPTNDGLHVVVRLTQSKGLEGAFRVQVLPESLQQAGLNTGDLCKITNEEGTTGYGIAWRADDKINRPKNRPAKMTDIFQSAFGFEEGSRVTISRTASRIHRADKIVLSDVTPPEYTTQNEIDDGLWQARVIGLFAACEALTPGITFDVTKRKSKRRFFVESIEAANAPGDTLFSYGDATTLNFRQDTDNVALNQTSNGSAAHVAIGSSNGTSGGGIANTSRTIDLRFELNTDRIGGLVDQCLQLDLQIKRLLHPDQQYGMLLRKGGNPAILLHGYEGTGKSMLLGKIAECSFNRVVRIDLATLDGGTVPKNKALIASSFQEAMKHQPSLIMMDDLEKLLGRDDSTYRFTFDAHMRHIQGARVMVAGATRKVQSIADAFVGPGFFMKLIELHIPDLAAREQIMNVLRKKPAYAKDTVSAEIASRTYGFTGRDMAMLYETAAIHAADRLDLEQDDMASGGSSIPPAYSEVASPATDNLPQSRNGDHEDILLCDFEIALREVRPTALREIFAEKPKTSWSDIGGSSAVQNSFDRVIAWPLQHGETLARFRYEPPKGILLYGPPGCSKTLTAQAVANTYSCNFIAVKGAELVSMYVGESERAIREVFRKARTAAPCVIFFDEIDAIGSNRDGGTQGLNVLTTLLNEMDGFGSARGVLILAATNKPESLDPALMRPGRLDSHVYLGPPNDSARKEILDMQIANVPLSSDVSFETLVVKMAGYSGAEIVRMCHAAKEPAIEKTIAGEDAMVNAACFEAVLATARRGITQEMLEAYAAFSTKNA